MFTGLLPSEHRAHFQTMGYTGSMPTIAEELSKADFRTEIVTRNSIFDGSIPGITRGFQRNVRLTSQRRTLDPLSLMLAASKPRFRRQIQTSGFFHPWQRNSRDFVMEFARATLPADRRSLEYVFNRARELHSSRQPFFICANLYDVHAPYPPSETSILSSFSSAKGLMENCLMPFVMPCLGGHTYLRPGFRLSKPSRQMLRSRYAGAVELMGRKLEAFYAAASDTGILDDTLLVITSDHGEAFGEHDLYLHDASVYDTHLHVPLWVRYPGRSPESVDDVVSTRDLFGLMRSSALSNGFADTILDPSYRRDHPVALAEHFYYPHCPMMDSRYRQNQRAIITRTKKVIGGRHGLRMYDRGTDRGESMPIQVSLADVEGELRQDGLTHPGVRTAAEHLGRPRENVSLLADC